MSTKTRKKNKGKSKKDQKAEQAPVDMAPMIEMYVTIFCKHLYYNPTIDRDIQIIIL